MAGALGDLRVIDLTRMLAGPLTTSLLGQLGAEIIKVEEPGSGDTARAVPPFIRGESYCFMVTNPNKKGVTLNLKHPQGKEILKKLAEKGDVVISNFAPGVMERLGLGYEELKQVNPRLIYAATSGLGQTGPFSHWKSYDTVAQAMGGVMSVTGHPGDPPTRCAPSIADVLTPVLQMGAILAALHYRERTGRGQALDMAQLDAMCMLTSFEFWGWYFSEGKVWRQVGNRDVTGAPINCYLAKDGYVFLYAIGNAEWERAVKLMGQPELLEDPHMATPDSRIRFVEEVDAVVQGWVSEQTAEKVLEQWRDAGLVCAPVLDMEQVVNHPQVLARQMVVEQDHPSAGRVKVCGSVFKASETPGEIRTPAPLLGQHNEEVYCSLLGYSKTELKRWRREGVI